MHGQGRILPQHGACADSSGVHRVAAIGAIGHYLAEYREVGTWLARLVPHRARMGDATAGMGRENPLAGPTAPIAAVSASNTPSPTRDASLPGLPEMVLGRGTHDASERGLQTWVIAVYLLNRFEGAGQYGSQRRYHQKAAARHWAVHRSGRGGGVYAGSEERSQAQGTRPRHGRLSAPRTGPRTRSGPRWSAEPMRQTLQGFVRDAAKPGATRSIRRGYGGE